jgi:hypothetical protein
VRDALLADLRDRANLDPAMAQVDCKHHEGWDPRFGGRRADFGAASGYAALSMGWSACRALRLPTAGQ